VARPCAQTLGQLRVLQTVRFRAPWLGACCGCGAPAKTADTFRCSSKTARGEMLSALVKGESDPCQGSTGKLDCESALHLLQGGPRRLARRRADNPQRRWLGVGAAAAGAGGRISEWTARWENRRRHPYATSACSVFLICLVVRI